MNKIPNEVEGRWMLWVALAVVVAILLVILLSPPVFGEELERFDIQYDFSGLIPPTGPVMELKDIHTPEDLELYLDYLVEKAAYDKKMLAYDLGLVNATTKLDNKTYFINFTQ